MSKKQPVKPAATNAKPSNATVNKKSYSDKSGFELSNKILVPAILLLFLVLTFLYCKPLMEGMRLSTHDSNQYLAMNKEVADVKTTTGHVALWSSRMFGGMPAFLMGGFEYSKITEFFPRAFVYKVIGSIPDPAMGILLLLICSFIGFYVLVRNPLLSLIGAIAVGFCTSNFISLDAGHITKITTLGKFLPMFAGIWLLFQKKYIWGVIITLIFVNESISGGHIQIAYYSLLLIGIYILIQSIQGFIKGEVKHVLTVGSILIGVFAISGMMNFYNYFVNDFSKDTTRGTAILNEAKMNPASQESKNKSTTSEKGVGFDYATNWSFGIEELGSLLVPNFVGGSSGAGLDENSNVYKTLSDKGVSPQQAGQFVQQMPLYWGSEPFVQGPVYLGAIVIFLFVFGLFAYRGNLKWWIVVSIILSVLIAMGKNFEPFYRLLYNIVPMFNKFRAPTMILALAQILMITLGVLGLKDFFDDSISDKTSRLTILKLSTGIVGGILVFFIVLGSIFSFQSKAISNGKSSDDQFKEQLTQMTGNQDFANDIYAALKKDRSSLMRSDSIRSLVFVGLAAALLFVFAFGKFRQQSVILSLLTLLILVDFWVISKRYLNDNDFEEKASLEMNAFPETPADAAILAQNKDKARMVDFTVDIFNSANPAYYHRTIGGYSPAKLRRYQDIVEYGLSYDFQMINKAGFAHANYLNMLNTKYLKQSPEANGVIQNQYALGNAWFVSNIDKVNTPEEEILKVRDINPANTAIVSKEFDAYVKDIVPNADSVKQTEGRFISMTDTKDPMKLEYNFKSPKDEFVVFSEVIYRPNQDWISYVDGKQVDHIRVNYILRGMKVKSGEHKITFEFKPKLYSLTNNIILIGNFIYYIIIFGLVYLLYNRNKKPAL